jgi:serine/threonine protein kinase
MKQCVQCQSPVPEGALYCPACGYAMGESRVEDDTPFIGRVLNQKYRLLEQLAEGGMALVYKAEHVYLKDLCAVKVIKRSLAANDEMLRRFRREAQLTRQAARRSRHIIGIYDFGFEEGVGFYYVMELLNGYPFTDLLLKGGQLPPPRRTVLLVSQICEALAAAHEEGMVHRDIKPDNIYIHREGEGEELVKILDFGIARPVIKATLLTSYGRVMGTPEYMSPEQCRGPTHEQFERGESHLDGRSDIYSLGVLLYQCLTGKVPFPMAVDGGPAAIHKVMAGHVLEEPTPPTEARPDVVIPPPLESAALKALAKKPEDRYQTMMEFREALLSCFPDLFAELLEVEGAPLQELSFPEPSSEMDTTAPQPPPFEEGEDEPQSLGDTAPGVEKGEQESNEEQESDAGEAEYEHIPLDRTSLDFRPPAALMEQLSRSLEGGTPPDASLQEEGGEAGGEPPRQGEGNEVDPFGVTFVGGEGGETAASSLSAALLAQEGGVSEQGNSGGEVDLAKTMATPFMPFYLEKELRGANSGGQEGVPGEGKRGAEHSSALPPPATDLVRPTIKESPSSTKTPGWFWGLLVAVVLLLLGGGLAAVIFLRQS